MVPRRHDHSGHDSATLTNGCYQYTLTGTNNAGTAATATSAIVMVDTGSPTFAITSSGSNVYTDGSATVWVKTGTTGSSFKLTATESVSGINASTVNFPTISGWNEGTVTTTATTASVTYTETASPGTGARSASVASNAGNTGTLNYTITADTVAPGVTVTFPVDGTSYSSSTWTGTITGTASDAASGVASTAVAVENTTTGKWWGGSSFNQSSADYLAATGTTSWTDAFASSNLTPGASYSVVAQATDEVGNVGTSTSASFSYQKLDQTISFTSTNPSPVTTSSPNYTPTATSTSGLTVAISLDASSTGCTLTSGAVDFTAAGTCLIDANQAGNASYNAAAQMQQSITVTALTILSLKVTSTSLTRSPLPVLGHLAQPR